MQFEPIVWNSENISEIAGSISIACWVIVFVPQIYENWFRKSTEGLSLLFIILWLAGDVFNLLGAMMQHLLPTMIILAAYYTIADIVLFAQCLWYGTEEKIDPIHFSPANPINENVLQDVFNEHQPLLINDSSRTTTHGSIQDVTAVEILREIDQEEEDEENIKRNLISDSAVVSIVIFAGFLSWYISYCNNPNRNAPIDDNPVNEVNLLAQFFGYLSAVLYLGSRVPQILLNFERKSCEGVSFLFFVFACLGNTAFIISVLVISLDPQYIMLNSSWLLGSSGTLIMDFVIFLQFFSYGSYNNSNNEVSV